MEVLFNIIYYNLIILCILNYKNDSSSIESLNNDFIKETKEIKETDSIIDIPKQKQMN